MCSIKMHHLMSPWRDLVSEHFVVCYPCTVQACSQTIVLGGPD